MPELLPESSRSQAPLRVLIVDDNRDLARVLELLFRMQGHEVRTTWDGPTALEVARVFRPEAVIVDIGLPGMSGLEVAQCLRREAATANALIIAASGFGQPDDMRRSKEAGCDLHLVKPVDLKELAQVVGRARER